MSPRPAFIRGLAALLCLLVSLPPVLAEQARTPRRLIDTLNVEVRKILENPKSTRTPEDAEAAVAEQIIALIRSDEGHLSLTQPDEQGRSPLMVAAGSGHALIVQALLTAPGVRLTVDTADNHGETAWMLAQFAPSVTLVACQPGLLTLERAQLLPPYLRRMSHLLRNQHKLTAIVQSLQDAGAAPRPDEARRAWLARCPNATPALREALADAPLLRTLVRESLARVTEFNRIGLDKPRSLPAKPPADMKFIRDGIARKRISRLDDLLTFDPTRCEMAKPQVPLLSGAGVILFKVVADTRAGVVEAVDIDVVSVDGLERSTDTLRAVVVETFARYRCEGDFLFEQEFHFTVS